MIRCSFNLKTHKKTYLSSGKFFYFRLISGFELVLCVFGGYKLI